MNIRNIKALAGILRENGLTAIEIADGETKIRLEKSAPAISGAQPVFAATAQVPAAPDGGPVNFNNLTEVRSPMVGVFYSAPSPESEPYVQLGSRVKKGDELCIIEAMKLMNEVCAETDGEIVDICVGNGQVVEYAQVLFKLF